jgi:RND family efflux transporter MFP subunit
MSRRYVFLVLIAVVVGVLAAVALASRGRRGLDVRSVEVTTGTIVRDVMTTGTLEPATAVDAGTQVSGTIMSLDADFNTRVRAGEVIARLDPSTYESQVAQARGALAEAEGNVLRLQTIVEDAKVKLQRAEQLAAQDLVPRTELETAQVTFKQAAADLRAQQAEARAARAQLTHAQVNRNHTIIRSPIDGVIINRAVEVGQTLAASVQSPVLFTIADLRHMHLFADINEAEVGEIKQGTPVTFEVESLGSTKFDATIAELRLEPKVQQATSGSANTSSSSTTAATTTGASSTTGAATTTGGAAAARSGSTGTTGTAAQTTSTVGTSGLATSSGPGVVSYTAVINVDNSEGRLAPGTTATITLPVGRRANVPRIPNNALTFRPSPQMFDTIGQEPPELKQLDADDAANREAYVWKYENGKFVPILVRVGIADEQFTELLSGEVRAGDLLVSSATVPR